MTTKKKKRICKMIIIIKQKTIINMHYLTEML